jgi:hypothetical protein
MIRDLFVWGCFGLPRELQFLLFEPESPFVRYGDGAVFKATCPECILVTEGTTSIVGSYVDVNDDGSLFVPGGAPPRATNLLDREAPENMRMMSSPLILPRLQTWSGSLNPPHWLCDGDQSDRTAGLYMGARQGVRPLHGQL